MASDRVDLMENTIMQLKAISTDVANMEAYSIDPNSIEVVDPISKVQKDNVILTRTMHRVITLLGQVYSADLCFAKTSGIKSGCVPPPPTYKSQPPKSTASQTVDIQSNTPGTVFTSMRGDDDFIPPPPTVHKSSPPTSVTSSTAPVMKVGKVKRRGSGGSVGSNISIDNADDDFIPPIVTPKSRFTVKSEVTPSASSKIKVVRRGERNSSTYSFVPPTPVSEIPIPIPVATPTYNITYDTYDLHFKKIDITTLNVLNNIMFVGEGNFTFAYAFAAYFESWDGIVTTTLSNVVPSYKNVQTSTIAGCAQNSVLLILQDLSLQDLSLQDLSSGVYQKMHTYLNKLLELTQPQPLNLNWHPDIDATQLHTEKMDFLFEKHSISSVWFQCPWTQPRDDLPRLH